MFGKDASMEHGSYAVFSSDVILYTGEIVSYTNCSDSRKLNTCLSAQMIRRHITVVLILQNFSYFFCIIESFSISH